MKNIKTFEDFVSASVNEEKEGLMYKPKLQEIIKNASEIDSMLKGDEDLEAWVQDKITIASHNMDAILSYMNGTKEKPEVTQSKPLFSSDN
jgi:hypothetical protein